MKLSELIITLSILLLSTVLCAAEASSLIDNFEDSKHNSFEFDRLYIDDRTSGGGTQTTMVVKEGLLAIQGEMNPARGQPAWSSIVLPLVPMSNQFDASNYQGVRIRLRVEQGLLNVSANSTEIKNFDYHSAPIPIYADGQFHVVEIPFKAMKRGWSAQSKLDTRTLASLSIVAYSMQKSPVKFDLDEISFY